MEFLKKQWNLSSNANSEKIKHLSDELKMHPLVAEILLNRGFKDQNDIQSFLEPNLNNLMKFIGLRTHTGAQWEIQQVAKACLAIARDLWPYAVGSYEKNKSV